MNDWFIWNGARCIEYGMHVLELPPPTIPAERVTFTNVPGRPGSLTTLEGEDVYEDLVLTAQCVLPDPTKIPAIAAWLRGSVDVLYAEFGETLDEDKGKPTNKQFLLTALERLSASDGKYGELP